MTGKKVERMCKYMSEYGIYSRLREVGILFHVCESLANLKLLKPIL